MTSTVLCRYYMNGACNKGEDCAFSHDFAAMPAQTCRYFLAGFCAYGDKCRYDHVRPEWSAAASERAARQAQAASSQPPAAVRRPGMEPDDGRPLVPASHGAHAAWQPEAARRHRGAPSWGAADAAWYNDYSVDDGVTDPDTLWYPDNDSEDENAFEDDSYPRDSYAAGHQHSEAQDEAGGGRAGSPAGSGSSAGQAEQDASRGPGGARGAGDGAGGSRNPEAGLCGAFTLAGHCARRPCHQVHGAACPVRRPAPAPARLSAGAQQPLHVRVLHPDVLAPRSALVVWHLALCMRCARGRSQAHAGARAALGCGACPLAGAVPCVAMQDLAALRGA